MRTARPTEKDRSRVSRQQRTGWNPFAGGASEPIKVRSALQNSSIGRVVLQVLGVGAYFGLVVILYWWRLTDAGAVAIILGLLFLFKSVVDSGAISLRGLSPSDPGFNIGTPGMELLKALSFLGVGLGAWIDLAKAMQTGLVRANIPAAVIHLVLVCVFAICVTCCFARFTVALKNRSRR
jgi:hypothetical protein